MAALYATVKKPKKAQNTNKKFNFSAYTPNTKIVNNLKCIVDLR